MGESSMNAPSGDPSTPAAPGERMQVVLRNLTKRFGDRLILDRVSLTAQSGETVALIGPSGGGKSTLLRCINGLTSFEAGEVRVGAHVLRASAGPPSSAAVQPLRRLFGMVFQDFQLFPHLTALGNVIEAPVQVLGLTRTEATERGMALLERVGLADRASFYPRQLSGGQKQRVAIARALAMQPRGLLCDEITSALDPELKYEVLEVLEDLRKDGLTLLVVTHEIGFARRAADRVVVLAEGKVVEEGPPREVIDKPRTERTQRFLRSVLA
jgi:ABC-type polar amino acid transport system ATPase subunit